MRTSSAEVGTAPVDQSAATFQSPLTGVFQLIAAMSSLPFCSKRFSALEADAETVEIVQKQTEKDGVNLSPSLASSFVRRRSLDQKSAAGERWDKLRLNYRVAQMIKSRSRLGSR